MLCINNRDLPSKNLPVDFFLAQDSKEREVLLRVIDTRHGLVNNLKHVGRQYGRFTYKQNDCENILKLKFQNTAMS